MQLPDFTARDFAAGQIRRRMKRFPNHLIGIDTGDVSLFSDFENGGAMWTGHGPRERRRKITFSAPFRSPPVVQVAISLWDVDTTGSAMRAQVAAENVANDGCDLVFRTWADTRIARIRLSWTAFGKLPHADDWELY